jgi:mRNA-degrading endonuclease YafQ of YafQ-DinJ toxin-antitoxin module
VRLLATPRFLKSVPPIRSREVLLAMQAAGSAFENPHLHSGIGLRRIRPFIECRCGLDLRLVFQREKDGLVFHLCGTHGEVQAFLKNQR